MKIIFDLDDTLVFLKEAWVKKIFKCIPNERLPIEFKQAMKDSYSIYTDKEYDILRYFKDKKLKDEVLRLFRDDINFYDNIQPNVVFTNILIPYFIDKRNKITIITKSFGGENSLSDKSKIAWVKKHFQKYENFLDLDLILTNKPKGEILKEKNLLDWNILFEDNVKEIINICKHSPLDANFKRDIVIIGTGYSIPENLTSEYREELEKIKEKVNISYLDWMELHIAPKLDLY